METNMCTDCRRPTEVICDHSTGDTVCSECGLVLESHSVDQTSEWRTFADDDSKSDPNRVGMASNPLLDDNVLTTIITNPNGTKPNNVINRFVLRDSNVANKSNHALTTAFDRLSQMSDRLGLNKSIENRGCEIYKKVFHDDNVKTCRGRNLDAVLGACLMVACSEGKTPRTTKEVIAVVKDGNVALKDILKAKKFIMKQLVDNDNLAIGDGMTMTIRAGDIIKRFCSNLSIRSNDKVTKAAFEAAEKCEEEVDVRRSPVSVAAALIYVIVQLGGCNEVSLKDIAVTTGVAEGTIKNTYKDLYPHVGKIVPNWFANETQIKSLIC